MSMMRTWVLALRSQMKAGMLTHTYVGVALTLVKQACVLYKEAGLCSPLRQAPPR